MILKETLNEILNSQIHDLKDHTKTVPRELLNKIELETNHALIISGIRRCGKSTLLKQIMSQLEDCQKPDYSSGPGSLHSSP
jgi:predicted AAA+ superfamily ATPase